MSTVNSIDKTCEIAKQIRELCDKLKLLTDDDNSSTFRVTVVVARKGGKQEQICDLNSDIDTEEALCSDLLNAAKEYYNRHLTSLKKEIANVNP